MLAVGAGFVAGACVLALSGGAAGAGDARTHQIVIQGCSTCRRR
jgi:hypothetical protein